MVKDGRLLHFDHLCAHNTGRCLDMGALRAAGWPAEACPAVRALVEAEDGQGNGRKSSGGR